MLQTPSAASVDQKLCALRLSQLLSFLRGHSRLHKRWSETFNTVEAWPSVAPAFGSAQLFHCRRKESAKPFYSAERGTAEDTGLITSTMQVLGSFFSVSHSTHRYFWALSSSETATHWGKVSFPRRKSGNFSFFIDVRDRKNKEVGRG